MHFLFRFEPLLFNLMIMVSSKLLIACLWQFFFHSTHFCALADYSNVSTAGVNVSLRNHHLGASHATTEEKDSSPNVNLSIVFFLIIIFLLLALIAVVVYWLYCTKGGKKGKLFPWSKSSKSHKSKSSKKSQYPQTEESIKAERRAAVFS